MGNVSLIDGHIDEPKFTDNETKKALECCISDNPPCTTCKYDPDTTTCDECMGNLMKDALDLINRLEAENNLLRETNKQLNNSVDFVKTKDIAELKAENERLKYLLEREEKATLSLSKQCYKDGVKEFAEKLKEKAPSEISYIRTATGEEAEYLITSWAIDNLVKEMVGE